MTLGTVLRVDGGNALNDDHECFSCVPLFRSMACPYWLLQSVTGLERGTTVQKFWCLRTSMALSNKICSLKLLWLHIRYWSQERLSKFPVSNEQLTKMWSVLKEYTTRAASWLALYWVHLTKHWGDSVAEWLGSRTWNRKVAGSSPTLTTKPKFLVYPSSTAPSCL